MVKIRATTNQRGLDSKGGLHPSPLWGLQRTKWRFKTDFRVYARPIGPAHPLAPRPELTNSPLSTKALVVLPENPLSLSSIKKGRNRSLYSLYLLVQMKGKSFVNLFQHSIQKRCTDGRYEELRSRQGHTGPCLGRTEHGAAVQWDLLLFPVLGWASRAPQSLAGK